MLAGGLTETTPATPKIQEIANTVKPQLEEKTNETYEEFEAVEYKSQVVSGTNYYIKGFPGGAVVKNPPASAGDTGSSPGPGRSRMPRSS
ncbi:cystatin-A isoform X2 [Balaenoptera acutorostrata]|uniref:Cystatin-A isoform X2 n=1 Tax=Balaenoptera acutorostrata TaxID=9767 RepID=A0ABM3THX9_BALAC|nr:cystatin-A isoform X2 [Balaenoptera acutorostrata]